MPAALKTRCGRLLLKKSCEIAVLEQFIAEAVTRDYDGSENAALVGSAKLLDANATGRLFSDLMRRHMRVLHGPCVDLLAALVSRAKAAHKSESREPLGRIAEAVVSKLDEVGKRQGPQDWMPWQRPETARPVDAEFVTNLLNVLGNLEAGPLRESAAKSFASRPTVFDPLTILAPALAAVGQWDAAVVALWEHSIEFLLERSGQPPAPPKDWRQKVKIACSCADCRELQVFALNPLERTHRFSVRKDRRQHLHNRIDHHGLDMTHVTERKGSPQTLVCTKDRRSYERRCEQYRQDIAALQSLAEGAGKVSPEPANVLQRIQTACSLARHSGHRTERIADIQPKPGLENGLIMAVFAGRDFPWR